MSEKMFDFAIGNPPYQKESVGDNANDRPIYNFFYDAAFEVADAVELITPARFLFNAGSTPTKWNQKMLNNDNFKVLFYEQKSSQVFKNTDIKGGVCIGYYDKSKNFGKIGAFLQYEELNSIKKKVEEHNPISLMTIMTNRGAYRFSPIAYEEEPEELSKTSDARISTSAFERMPKLFTEEKPNDSHEYIQMFGNIKNKRTYRWFRKDYIEDIPNIYKYKVLVPKANGSGAIGEVLSTPLIGTPLIGFTETFISIGEVDTKEEAEAILKYVKTKFARAMLGILKVTQDNSKKVWKYVPMQDFTSNSDIDWSKSIHDVDEQLYKKYGLDEHEIEFIEKNVQEMV